MKESTLNTLLVAKSIYGETKTLINAGDTHSSTAGIILLQDFVELVVLAALDELDVDEQKALESKSFDELLGELKKQGIKIIKSGTIKALNKQRVVAKHYGQLAEPGSVSNYFKTAVNFVDDLLEKVLGKKLQEVFISDIIEKGRAKEHIEHALKLSEEAYYLDALIELRKAFFNIFEYDYCIYRWKNHEVTLSPGIGLSLMFGGHKAPTWTKNKAWISANVKTPSDYVQIDLERLRMDSMEWGISTVDIENFRRLTPTVVETEPNSWHFDYDSNLPSNEATQENFNYCLDLVVGFIVKKQRFDASRKWPNKEKIIPSPPIYIGKPVFVSPSTSSTVIYTVQQDDWYSVERVVTGFDVNEQYLYVHLYKQNGAQQTDHVFGYMLN